MKDYIYMGNRLLAEYKPQEDKTYFYTPDQINSTRIVTDDTGTVVYSAAHDPYGGMQKTWVNTYDPTPKFSGKERDGDAESGLDYFGARYYDKSLYRFISVDPLILSQSANADPQMWNLYSYCRDNPLFFVDLAGKWPFPVHYNFTLYLGIKAGLPFSIAKMIANADAMVDKDLNTTASLKFSRMGLISLLVNALTGEIGRWHFPSLERLEECLTIARTTYNPKLFGQALHVIQDSYIHAGFNPTYGHGFLFDESPEAHPMEAENMAWFTLDLLSDFNARWQALMESIMKAMISIIPVVRAMCI